MMDTMKTPPAQNLAAAIRARFAPLGGVELDLPAREPMPAQVTVATRNAKDFEGCGIDITDL